MRANPSLRFQFTLALALGMTRARLITEITGEELAHWIAFYEVNPFGLDRGDLQAGIIASTIANVNSKKTFQPKDFMPDFDRKPKRQTMDQMQRNCMKYTGLAKAAERK